MDANQIEYIHSHCGQSRPSCKAPISILQNSFYPAIKDHLAARNIHVIRNPLSILLSAYYSHKLTHSIGEWSRLESQRKLLCSVSLVEGLLLTAAFLNSPEFSPKTPGPFCALKSWDFDDDRITTIRMEDATMDPQIFLEDFFGLWHPLPKLPRTDQFRFENFTGRRLGEIDDSSHYRCGDESRWRAEVPKIAADYVREEFRNIFERFYPDSLRDG